MNNTCINNLNSCTNTIMAKSLCTSCYKKEYRKSNLEKLAAQAKSLRDKNLELFKDRVKRYKYTAKGRYRYITGDAKRRGLTMTLTLQQYSELIILNCEYCDKPPAKACSNGLDRIENSVGYEYDNVVPCCRECNVMRNNVLTYIETIVAMDAVLKFRKGVQDVETKSRLNLRHTL